ncbi:hypothetical protein F5X99DRAFT_373266 [Biscogniauxia marginata]|nr:hypothetical protein F5X99DRAFT_373266 [Biscogniauxia marginata]
MSGQQPISIEEVELFGETRELALRSNNTPTQQRLPGGMSQASGSQATGVSQDTIINVAIRNEVIRVMDALLQAPAPNPWGPGSQPIVNPTHNPAEELNDPATNTPAETPDEQNCSVYVTNLPPQCTIRMLLSSIRNVGKVFASHISPPSGSHSTAAATITFWDQASTARFMEQSRNGHWRVEGYTPYVRYNRIRAEPQRPSPRSRVLHIRGPADLLGEEYLKRVFRAYCTYELECVSGETLSPSVVQFEFRFSSFRAQSHVAYKVCNALRNRSTRGLLAVIANEDADFNNWMGEDELDKWSRVNVHWAADPCAYGGV